MKNLRLLAILHSYNSFQKDQIECLSPYIDCINAMIRYNPLAEISNYTKLFRLNDYNLNVKIDPRNKPNNVHIHKNPIIYYPSDNQYKKLGHKHYNAVARIIKDQNIDFDLIHSHFTWSSGFVGSVLKEEYRIPFIVTAHGYDINNLPFRDNEWRDQIKSILDNADYIITVSNKNLEYINKLNIKTPVTVIPNGFRNNLFFPMDQIECRRKLNLPLGKKIILTVGNFVEEKGHKYLIKTLSKIIKVDKNVLCVIIGSGILEGTINKLIKKEELNGFIKLPGRIPHHEIAIWMNACDLFVLPSISEGNPTVMFEALGCGKPVIGTAVGGIPEIIKSNEHGLVCKPADPDELAEALLMAMNKDWNSESILQYSYNFTWDLLTKKIIKIYNDVL